MARAVEYAEKDLGVHSVYEKAGNLHDQLVNLQLELEGALQEKRTASAQLELIEFDTMTELRSINSAMSEAGFSRMLKGWLAKDSRVSAARHKVENKTISVSYLEHQVRATDFAIKIEVARMHELGGYLAYLAAVKNASVSREASDSPWAST